MKSSLLTAAVGVFLGFGLSRIGFASWDEVHRMFVFADLRMFLAFVTAVVLLAGIWPVVSRKWSSQIAWRVRPIQRGTALGAVLFGAGWALCGACPSIALVQLGEGQLAAVWTLSGILAGNWLYAALQQRHLHWQTNACLDE